ncbi:hypothetical protein PENANT_c254G07091, partial [Penicillium antarcticum]
HQARYDLHLQGPLSTPLGHGSGYVTSSLVSTRLLCQTAIVPSPFYIGVPGKARLLR